MSELNLDIFPKVSNNEWIDLAKKQLKGEDPITTLSWTSDSRLVMKPYYDQSDIEKLSDQIKFFENLKPFYWKLYEQVTVNDEKTANAMALEALQGGCNGVVFKLDNQIDFAFLTSEILLDICDISIYSSIELEEIPDSLHGFIVTPNQSNSIDAPNENSQIESILMAVKNISDEQHILRLASPDFFLEIASIRALKYLLYTQLNKDPSEIQIHTTVPPHSNADHQLFFNPTSGLASVLGGSTSVSFSTAEGNSRISRNVGNLIREESGILQYTDQCGGSYYIEALTNAIVQECLKDLND